VSPAFTTFVTVTDSPPSDLVLTLSATTINENETVRLDGSFIDFGAMDAFLVTIDWGDGSPPTLIRIDPVAGMRVFSPMHHYLDDNPTGTPSDLYTIAVTVRDTRPDDPMSLIMGTRTIRVNNVPPTLSPLTRSATTINENGELTVSGTFTDPGSLDTFT